jgi:hypothetical protein
MRRDARAEGPSKRNVKLLLFAGWAAALGALALPQSASAQFFWDQPRFSADDAARAVMARGFRPLSQPVRKDDVYIADVIDRRGRHERLAVNVDSGQIVQRFIVENGRDVRRYVDPTIPRGPVPPASIPEEDNQPNIFSRLFGGGNDDNQNGQPGLDHGLPPPVPMQPRPPRIRRPPRIVERTPEPIRPAPIETSPLAPPGSQAAPDAVAPGSPAPAAGSPPSDRPTRSIVTNPLAIPGTREQDDAAGHASANTAPHPAAAAPKPAAPAANDVPVAPLD